VPIPIRDIRYDREIDEANASGNTPVVFIHGLWLLPSSWANWVDFFSRPATRR
jgi:pimeloyl-ACP methyl ester carboxylesterase